MAAWCARRTQIAGAVFLNRRRLRTLAIAAWVNETPRCMDLLSPRPLWPIIDGIPRVFPPLETDVDCDVVVMGAGISGALIAWHLTEAGMDTVVIDRRAVAHGSTAGSTSLLQYE